MSSTDGIQSILACVTILLLLLCFKNSPMLLVFKSLIRVIDLQKILYPNLYPSITRKPVIPILLGILYFIIEISFLSLSLMRNFSKMEQFTNILSGGIRGSARYATLGLKKKSPEKDFYC